MDPEQIRVVRNQLGMSQEAFAAALGVSFATVNRWENGKAKPQKDRIERIKALVNESSSAVAEPARVPSLPIRLDFEGDADAVKLVVDAHRLQNGHLSIKPLDSNFRGSFRCRIRGLLSTSSCCPRILCASFLPTTPAPAKPS